MQDSAFDSYVSVEYAPDLKANVIFSSESAQVFREDEDINPVSIGDIKFMPWGADNDMPYNLMSLIDDDETVATCMSFSQEVAFGAGLSYKRRQPDGQRNKIDREVEEFLEKNQLNSVYMGQCADMKMFDFCVSVIILNEARTKIDRIIRKHAAYSRFGVADNAGNIPYIVYANWRNYVCEDNCEVIPLLRSDSLLLDLQRQIKENPKARKFAVASLVPKASSTYYPIPAYASLFRSEWYDIKKLIGKAKKAKLKNSAPIKYHIEVDANYWRRALEQEGITDPEKKKEHVKKLKKQMIDFLSGAENSGKVLFSARIRTPDGKDIPEVTVTKISSDEKEGGDYTTDIQEAVNMICFSMRVHSNLVGSVPGKAQSNNSGSDKRELYTIAQTLQKPYHSIMLAVHDLVCKFNGWSRQYKPAVDIIQLTTLDQHKDYQTT